MRCPKCGTNIEIRLQDSRQLIVCPVCNARLRPKLSSDGTQQLKQLLNEIARAFPDKTVDIARWDHEKWDDRTALFCAQLGYTNVGTFLQAYGFRVQFTDNEEPDSRKKGTVATIAIVMLLLAMIAVGVTAFAYFLPKTEESSSTGNSEIQVSQDADGHDQAITPPELSTPNTVPNNKKYASVFDAYSEACSIGVNAYREVSMSQSRPTPYFPNCVEAIGYGYYESGYPLYFAYYDVNEDGTDELFIGQSNGQIITLLDMYSYDGNEPVKLFPDISFGSRSNLTVTQNHELVVNGSSGADNPSAEYYWLPTGSCKPQFSHGYCSYAYAGDYPDHTPVDISCWFDYVETTGIHAEFSWSAL